MHARQLERRDDDLEEATLHLQRMWLEEKERHDEKHGIWHEELAPGDIVLLHDTRREKNMFCKLAFKWLGPYQIYNSLKDKDTYMLEELDGSRLAGTFAGLEHEEIPTLDDFLAGDDDNSDLSDIPPNLPDTSDEFWQSSALCLSSSATQK